MKKELTIYSFLRESQVWEAFMQWRHAQEQGMNFFQLKANQKFDTLLSKVCKNNAIVDDKSLLRYLLLTYQDTGARKTMRRIKVVFEAFKAEYQADKHANKS